MPKITRTLYKKNTEPWIVTTADYIDVYFSQEEKENIILPYNNMVNQANGYIQDSFTQTFEGDTYTWSREYDTMENLQNAMIQMSDGNNSIVSVRNEKLKEVMNNHGISSYRATTLIHD